MPRKPKINQSENVEEISGRDLFQTPNYATDILVPFLNEIGAGYIWECAAGLGKIVNRLEYHKFNCLATDLAYPDSLNYLTEKLDTSTDTIVTNPPFSLKRKFYMRCREYGKPFALLIPADYSGWIIQAVDKDGAEKIVPTRRIDYITPNTLQRIWEGEMFLSFNLKCTFKEFKESKRPDEWRWLLAHNTRFKFDSIYSAPAHLLRKYSSSYYHSMWLTWGFGLGKSETFVELTNEMKNNI